MDVLCRAESAGLWNCYELNLGFVIVLRTHNFSCISSHSQPNESITVHVNNSGVVILQCVIHRLFSRLDAILITEINKLSFRHLKSDAIKTNPTFISFFYSVGFWGAIPDVDACGDVITRTDSEMKGWQMRASLRSTLGREVWIKTARFCLLMDDVNKLFKTGWRVDI